MADVSAGLEENHDIKATEADEKGEAIEVKPSMSSHTNETGDNSQNASSSSPLNSAALPQKQTQDTTPKKMEKTEKERENKERGRPSSGSPSLTKTSPVKVANTDSRHGREEKVRLARERQEEERRRKIEEFRESNQRAAEFRRKQEDERQRKIVEARQKELDRRMTVEERRKKLFQEENERKQAILRKTAERESKLSQHRSSSRQHAIFGFGSSVPRMSDPLDANKRAISHASLPRRSLNSSGVTDGGVDDEATRAPPRAMSAWSLSRKSTTTTTAAASCDKQADLSSASAVVSNSIKRPSMKRLSTSTSQLSKKKLTLPDGTLQKHALVGCSIGNISEDTSSAATTAPIARRPKSSYSDNTLSSSEWSPMRRPRPHSVGGRLPSYASPTFSSQAHQGRSTEKKADGSVSPVGKLRSKSADPSSARRSRADLRRTFERLSAPKVPSPKDTSASTKATPVKDKTSARSSTRSLSSQRQGSARPSPVTSVANTAAKPKSTPPKMQPAVARTVTPALKPSMPSVSKNSKPTPKGPVKAVHIKVTTSQEKKPPAKKAPSPKEASPVKEKKPPGEDTAKTEEKAKQLSEDDYKAKLAEKRRQAREKAERDAEEAKQREEQRIREEEERKRKEEEEQRRLEEEELRLAEEARIAEAERLKKAIEAEEKRKKEEEERLEAEKKAKEEAEKAAQEEAERKEAERLVRMKREEEERIARKKKLEMIMKRVKVDDTSPKSETATNSVPAEEKVGGEESPAAVVAATTATAPSDEGAPKFKSALLQQMLGNKGRLGRSTEKLSDSSKSSSEEKEDDVPKKAEDVVPVTEVTEEQELKEQEEQNEQQKAETEQVQHPPETWQEQQQDAEQPQQQEPALEQQSESVGQGEEVQRDEGENSEEKPVIQMNDIVIEDAGERGEVVDDPASEAAPVQSTESLQQGDSIAEGKDSCSELGNGDLVGNTDVVVSGNGEVDVMSSVNADCLSDEDTKESLRERLEQDKDIDTAEVDSVRSGDVVSEDVQRTETTTVSSAVCADPPDLLGGLGSAAVSGGHRDLNGFSRCDENSDDMLQLDGKLDMRPNGSSSDHFEQVIDLGKIEGDKQLINLGLDMMTDGQTVPPSAPLIAFEENANKGLPGDLSVGMPAEESRQKQFTEDEFCGGKEAMSPLIEADSVEPGVQQVNVFDAQFEMSNVDPVAQAESTKSWASSRDSMLVESSQDPPHSCQQESMDGDEQRMGECLKDIPSTEEFVSDDKVNSELGTGHADSQEVETNNMAAVIPEGGACDMKTVESFVCDVMNNAITQWLSSDNDDDVTAVNQGAPVGEFHLDHQIMNCMSDGNGNSEYSAANVAQEDAESPVVMETENASNFDAAQDASEDDDVARDDLKDDVAIDTSEADAASEAAKSDVVSEYKSAGDELGGDVDYNASEADITSDACENDVVSDRPEDYVTSATSERDVTTDALEDAAGFKLADDQISVPAEESAPIEHSHAEDESVSLSSREFDAAFQAAAVTGTFEGHESNDRQLEAVEETRMEDSNDQMSAHINVRVIPEHGNTVEEEGRSYEDDEVFDNDASSGRDDMRVFPTVYGIADGVPRDAGAAPTEFTFNAPPLGHSLEEGDGPVGVIIGGAEGAVGEAEESKDDHTEMFLGEAKTEVDPPECHPQSGLGDTASQPQEDVQLMRSGSSCSDDQAFVYSEESDSSDASSSSDADYRPHTSHGHNRPMTVRPDRLDVTGAVDPNPAKVDESADTVHCHEGDDKLAMKDPLGGMHADSGDSPLMSREDPYMTYVASGGQGHVACPAEDRGEDQSKVNI